jgi:hypothetical protein
MEKGCRQPIGHRQVGGMQGQKGTSTQARTLAWGPGGSNLSLPEMFTDISSLKSLPGAASGFPNLL